jgi:hypothetical protein
MAYALNRNIGEEECGVDSSSETLAPNRDDSKRDLGDKQRCHTVRKRFEDLALFTLVILMVRPASMPV